MRLTARRLPVFLLISLSLALSLYALALHLISVRLEGRIPGEFPGFEASEVEVTPILGVKLKGVYFSGEMGWGSFPFPASLRADEIVVYPRLLPLLKGEFSPASITVSVPSLSLSIEDFKGLKNGLNGAYDLLERDFNDPVPADYKKRKKGDFIPSSIALRGGEVEIVAGKGGTGSLRFENIRGKVIRRQGSLEGKFYYSLKLSTGDIDLEVKGGLRFRRMGRDWAVSLSKSLPDMGTLPEGLYDLLHVRVYSGKMDLGLTLEPEGSGRAFSSAFTLDIESMSLFSPHLSQLPWEGLFMSLSGEVFLERDLSSMIVNLPAIRFNSLNLMGDGRVGFRRGEDDTFTMNLYSPQLKYQGILDSIPPGIFSRSFDISVDGDIAFHFTISGSLKRPHRISIDFDWDAEDPVMTSCGDIEMDYLNVPFVHTFIDPEGELREIVLGYGNPDWTPLSEIPNHFIHSLLVTEDINFFNHRGFDFEELKNSIRKDIKERGFKRGGSTLSQQLAKNLFLSGEKTIVRKIEEFILTGCMERVVSKRRILEIYLNIVEWGPGIYGIARASRHYFDKNPPDLTLPESLFLCSILPSPRRYYIYFLRGLTENWRKRMGDILGKLLHHGFISIEEYYDTLIDELEFRGPEAPSSSAAQEPLERQLRAGEEEAQDGGH